MSETRSTSELVTAEWEIFYGAATDAEASVYASIPLVDSSQSEVQLRGSVTGPTCKYAHTLTASVALRDLGANPTPLAEARISDPCFWTPEAPYLYEVDVTARQDQQILTQEKRNLGIRRLGVEGKSIFLDGERWVPRAGSASTSQVPSFNDCRTASLGLIVADPSDDLCGVATRDGVFLVAVITSDSTNVVDAVRRFATFAAVGIVIVENPPDADQLKAVARNVILSQTRSDADHQLPHADWCDAVAYEVGDPQRAAEFAANCELPVIAWRAEVATSPGDARSSCDRLQRDLAEHSDFAGYFV